MAFDGTLLNPQFVISETDMAAVRRAHALGVEVMLVTGRRHTFALPIAHQFGFDLWLSSSNGFGEPTPGPCEHQSRGNCFDDPIETMADVAHQRVAAREGRGEV